jgi:hypothetical protein
MGAYWDLKVEQIVNLIGLIPAEIKIDSRAAAKNTTKRSSVCLCCRN